MLEQIDQGAASIERVTGKRPVLFRPPFGKLDDFGQQAVRERGLDLLLWSVEKQDMQRVDSHEVFRELVGQIEYKEGGIVLLHDIRWTSIAVLRELLGWLQRASLGSEEAVALRLRDRRSADVPARGRSLAAAVRDARRAGARARGRGARARHERAPPPSGATSGADARAVASAAQPPLIDSQTAASLPTNLPSRACTSQ